MKDAPKKAGRSLALALAAVVGAALVGGAGLLASAGLLAGVERDTLAYNPYNLVRLHVLAASDEPGDQALKLQARDAVLRFLTPRWGEVKNPEQALAVLEANRAELGRLLEELMARSGRKYEVKLEIGRFPFPERDYGGVVLPAGIYPALRVTLGEGKGHNWWCVLFPPLCFLDARLGSSLQPALAKELAGEALSSGSTEPRVRSWVWDWFRSKSGKREHWAQRWEGESASP